tara:strand:+ start:495 stop:752 length:258 start_codon:yes stop_codon:yes gene_type:complete
MKYKIVRYSGINNFIQGDENKGKDKIYKEFEDLVSEHLNEGWKCQGSSKTKYTMWVKVKPLSVPTSNPKYANAESYSFEQAMIKD